MSTKLGKNPTEISQFTQEQQAFQSEKRLYAQRLEGMRVETETYKQGMISAQRKLEEEMKKRHETRRPAGKNE
jgi:hypothetical protein